VAGQNVLIYLYVVSAWRCPPCLLFLLSVHKWFGGENSVFLGMVGNSTNEVRNVIMFLSEGNGGPPVAEWCGENARASDALCRTYRAIRGLPPPLYPAAQIRVIELILP